MSLASEYIIPAVAQWAFSFGFDPKSIRRGCSQGLIQGACFAFLNKIPIQRNEERDVSLTRLMNFSVSILVAHQCANLLEGVSRPQPSLLNVAHIPLLLFLVTPFFIALPRPRDYHLLHEPEPQ